MSEKHKILIVDDDSTAVELLKDLLSGNGYAVESALTVREAMSRLKTEGFKAIIADLRMPELSGMDLLDHCVHHYPETPLIMLTAHGSIQSAVEALKRGAFDYLTKPIQLEELLIVIEKAIAHERMRVQNIFLKAELDKSGNFLYDTKNPELQKIYRTIESLRGINSTILLEGESGTGKEIMARYIHSSGNRAAGNFVPINCGAIPEGLIESELFGYEKGAFTDAKSRMKGKLEIADGGILFLDEISELTLKAQVALLRFLQERELIPLGSSRRIPIDARIIAATNQNLGELVRRGNFREDLYYRINVIPLRLPPLRRRREDILPLACWFLERFRREYNRPVRSLSRSAEEALLNYSWPGNIRELRNVVERAAIIEQSSQIRKDSLLLCEKAVPQTLNFEGIGIVELKKLEDTYIHWVLDRLGGNRSLTAKQLGLSVRGLRYKLNAKNPE